MDSRLVSATVVLRGLRWSYRRYGVKGAAAFLLGIGAIAYLWRSRGPRRKQATAA